MTIKFIFNIINLKYLLFALQHFRLTLNANQKIKIIKIVEENLKNSKKIAAKTNIKF